MKLYSNGPRKDFVSKPYQELISSAQTIFVASPYVTMTNELHTAALNGKQISLLVGLNAATNPQALRNIFGVTGISIRYYTGRFYAKIFLSETCALIGSSNLTDGGMHSNREATVLLDEQVDVDEIRSLSQELWSRASILTPAVLKTFESTVGQFGRLFNPDKRIEDAVGKHEPQTMRVGSEKKSSEYLYLQALKRRVYEQFKPAFDEVTKLMSASGVHRPEWQVDEQSSETNRFLNWVRLIHGPSEEWRKAPPRSPDNRAGYIASLVKEWAYTRDPRIPHDFFDNMEQLRRVFASRASLEDASLDDLSNALMGVHAFEEQIRFIKGGYGRIIPFFWEQNEQDIARVKRTFTHLMFDEGDFIAHLYDVLNFPEWKVRYFGESCALELTGTIRPNLCPPMNGRSAKGLRVLGFDVPAS